MPYKDPEKQKAYLREYQKTYIRIRKGSNKNWRKNHPEAYRLQRQKTNRNYRKKYPERIKANKYANQHNQRREKCLICGDIEKLHFHHTDYKKNEGFTICLKHHRELHPLSSEI